MWLWIFIACLVVGAGGAAVLLERQRRIWRAGDRESAPAGDWLVGWEDGADLFYRHFASFFVHLGRSLYFYTLVLLRRLTTGAKLLLGLIEKKFARMIDAVRGHGPKAKGGQASLFLTEIKLHKDNLTRPRSS